MKTLTTALFLSLSAAVPGWGALPAVIGLGTPHRKVFPATKDVPQRVYIEVPVKISNTSQAPIGFSNNAGPGFVLYVRQRKNSKHWTDLYGRQAMCGMGAYWQTLAPGESSESTVFLDASYSGRPFRLVLPVSSEATDRKSGIRITSATIVLP